MTPREFAEAVLAPGLTWDQIQAIISADVVAELTAIQARREDDAVVLALPAPTAHPAQEAA